MKETENYKGVSQTMLSKELKCWIASLNLDHGKFSEILCKLKALYFKLSIVDPITFFFFSKLPKALLLPTFSFVFDSSQRVSKSSAQCRRQDGDTAGGSSVALL